MQLRVQLSFHYADVERREEIAGVIIHACLSKPAEHHDSATAPSP
jgi:hypothetical protein